MKRASTRSGKIFSYTLFLSIGAILCLMMASFMVGAYTYFVHLLEKTGVKEAGYIPIFFIGQAFVIKVPVTLTQLFVALLLTYAIIFIFSFKGAKCSTLTVFKKMAQGSRTLVFKNELSTVALIFPLLAVTLTVIESFQDMVGIPSGSLPELEPARSLTFITLAPITEELGFRASIIGLVSVIMMVAQGEGLRSVKALLFPSIGYQRRSEAFFIAFLIVFTAITFGYAHIASGIGWKIGKFTTATVAGVVLGWVYVKSGLLSAILLHWCFNFLMSSYRYLEKAINIPVLSVVEAIVVASAIGIIFALLYFTKRG